ncbi:MAG: hypothetical protein KW806_02395 [Candidatus Yanofskybacteria bacterium]|nr:hypothetical protein [Candidatus Yanofskybacteria bacterium]
MAQKNPTQSNLIIYLVVVVGFVAGFLYNSQLSTPVTIPAVSQEGADTLRTLQNLKINYGMLDNASYKALSVFGELPVVAGPGGKSDPFAP